MSGAEYTITPCYFIIEDHFGSEQRRIYSPIANHLTHARQQVKNEKPRYEIQFVWYLHGLAGFHALSFIFVPSNVRQCVRVDLHVPVLLFYGTCDAVELGNPPRQLPNDTDNIVLPRDCRSIATVAQM